MMTLPNRNDSRPRVGNQRASEYQRISVGNSWECFAGLSCSDNCKANTAVVALADLFAESGPPHCAVFNGRGIVDHGKGIRIPCLRIWNNPKGCVKVAGGRSLRRPPDQSAKTNAPSRGARELEGLKTTHTSCSRTPPRCNLFA